MYTFDLEATDAYSVLGRVLDRSRVAGLRLSAVTTEENGGRYAIAVTLDTADHYVVDRLARQFAGMFGVISVNVEHEPARRPFESAFAAARPIPEAMAAGA